MITSVLTAPPANARMSVCVIVPIMSRPTAIPDSKSSRIESAGLAALSSHSCDVTDMEMSITAPSEDMRIPENRRPDTSSLLFCPTYANVSISLTFSPEICPSEPNTLATKPATSTPTTVATIEQSVFADQPPIRYIPTTVTSTTTSTAVQKGDAPL